MSVGLAEDQDGIRLSVRCRVKSGTAADLEVLDISPGGCMVVSKGWEAQPGDRVLTTLRGLGLEPSRLVWIEDGRAGIAFERPLHAAVYDHLLAQLEGRVAVEGKSAAEVIADEEAAKKELKKRVL